MTWAGIPTMYAGVNFRSRLEARWAAMFNVLGIDWAYEPIDLPGWIPDFRVGQWYCEVKPEISDDGLDKHVAKIQRSVDEYLGADPSWLGVVMLGNTIRDDGHVGSAVTRNFGRWLWRHDDGEYAYPHGIRPCEGCGRARLFGEHGLDLQLCGSCLDVPPDERPRVRPVTLPLRALWNHCGNLVRWEPARTQGAR
jgi:hypothetical protein